MPLSDDDLDGLLEMMHPPSDEQHSLCVDCLILALVDEVRQLREAKPGCQE